MNEQLKKNISLITPPGLIQLFRLLRGLKPYTFDGYYCHIDDVLVKTSNDIYHNSKIIQRLVEDSQVELEKIQHDFLPKSNYGSSVGNLLPLLIETLYQKTNSTVNILDFGGGVGIGYINAVKVLGTADHFFFSIVELPELCKAATPIFKTLSNIDFHSNLASIKSAIDIVNAGSVLQYIVNYQEKINELCAFNPQFIFMTDHYMGEGKTYATKQVNLPDVSSAYWIFNLQEIIDIFLENGYKLIYKSTNCQKHIFNSNISKTDQVKDSCNLLFKKV